MLLITNAKEHTLAQIGVRMSNPELFDKRQISFTYTNYKGETRLRTVVPVTIRFGLSEFHKGEQWFLTAFDVERECCPTREFAINDIEGFAL